MWHRVKVVPSVFLAGETSCTKRKYPRKAWRNITIFPAFFFFSSLSLFFPSLALFPTFEDKKYDSKPRNFFKHSKLHGLNFNADR